MLKYINLKLKHMRLELRLCYSESVDTWLAVVGLEDSKGFHSWFQGKGSSPKKALKALDGILKELFELASEDQPIG